MVVNWAPFSGSPAQDKTFKISRFVYQITGITIFGELNVALDLCLFGLQVADEAAQRRKRHLLCLVLEFVNRRRKVH